MVAVEDGVDALRHIDVEAPQAVVLDIELPRLGGLDVQREIAAHPETRDIPIVVVTGTLHDLNLKDVACILRNPRKSTQFLEAFWRRRESLS